MATLGELKAEIFKAIGRDDSDAAVMVKRAVNSAMVACMSMFQPKESQKSATIVTVPNNYVLALSTQLTRPLRIIKVYNATSLKPMYALPFHMWFGPAYEYIMVNETGGPRWYSYIWDNSGTYIYLYFAPIEADTAYSMYVYYDGYPSRLTNDADVFPYAHHEDFALALATSMTFAFLEENESSEMWSNRSKELAGPDISHETLSNFISGRVDYDNLQRSLQQGPNSAAA